MSDSDEESSTPSQYTWNSKRTASTFDDIPRPVKRSKHAPPTDEPSLGCSTNQEKKSLGDTGCELACGAAHDADEVGDPDVEELLNKFIEVHPMCGAALNSGEALHLLTKLPSNGQIPEMQIVSRSYDNSMLRPPDETAGERPCVNDKKCFCYFLGKHRHGENDARTFVCTEYLLPKEQRAWREGTLRLPECRTKCLICSRYYLHAMFLRIKTEPDFRASVTGKLLQDFRNDVCTHTCNVESNEGYPKSRLLSFHDKDGVSEPVMLFPFVGFNTKHYQLKLDDKGRPHAVQLNMIPRSDLNGRPSNE